MPVVKQEAQIFNVELHDGKRRDFLTTVSVKARSYCVLTKRHARLVS